MLPVDALEKSLALKSISCNTSQWYRKLLASVRALEKLNVPPIVVRFSHPLKHSFMVVTPEKSAPVKSMASRPSQERNIRYIVERLSEKLKVISTDDSA